MRGMGQRARGGYRGLPMLSGPGLVPQRLLEQRLQPGSGSWRTVDDSVHSHMQHDVEEPARFCSTRASYRFSVGSPEANRTKFMNWENIPTKLSQIFTLRVKSIRTITAIESKNAPAVRSTLRSWAPIACYFRAKKLIKMGPPATDVISLLVRAANVLKMAAH